MQRHEALVLLERIAGAIRLELGESIDAYPAARAGGVADPINRAFRATCGCLLGEERGPAPRASRALRRLASRRLAGEGWAVRPARLLIGGPRPTDDWLVFLVLSSRTQLEPLLDRGG